MPFPRHAARVVFQPILDLFHLCDHCPEAISFSEGQGRSRWGRFKGIPQRHDRVIKRDDDVVIVRDRIARHTCAPRVKRRSWLIRPHKYSDAGTCVHAPCRCPEARAAGHRGAGGGVARRGWRGIFPLCAAQKLSHWDCGTFLRNGKRFALGGCQPRCRARYPGFALTYGARRHDRPRARPGGAGARSSGLLGALPRARGAQSAASTCTCASALYTVCLEHSSVCAISVLLQGMLVPRPLRKQP